MTLCTRLVKLAHEKPELRHRILPLLKKAMRRVPVPHSIYVPKDAVSVDTQGTDLEIYTYITPRGKPGAVAFMGKSQKPLWYNSFMGETPRDKYIQDTIDDRKKTLAYKQEQVDARKNFQHGLQVGDILVGSWGYDQTQTDTYEVVGLPSPKMVELREIAQKSVSDDHVMPVPGKYVGPVIRKAPGPGGARINSVVSVHKWDGKPLYVTPWGQGH